MLNLKNIFFRSKETKKFRKNNKNKTKKVKTKMDTKVKEIAISTEENYANLAFQKRIHGMWWDITLGFKYFKTGNYIANIIMIGSDTLSRDSKIKSNYIYFDSPKEGKVYRITVPEWEKLYTKNY